MSGWLLVLNLKRTRLILLIWQGSTESDPETVFMMVGDGKLRPQIEEQVEKFKLKNKVILTGWRKDVARLIYSFDVLVLTSLFEGLPRVFPQAMCAKKPIVATMVDGAAEVIVDKENGFLLEPKDFNGIALKVIELLKDNQLRIKMGESGFSKVNEFDQVKMVLDIEKLYEEKLEKFKKLYPES